MADQPNPQDLKDLQDYVSQSQDPQGAVMEQGWRQAGAAAKQAAYNEVQSGLAPSGFMDPRQQEPGLAEPVFHPEDLLGGAVAGGLEAGVKSAIAPGSEFRKIVGNEVGAVGKGAVSEAERLANAKAMGFDASKTLYHGTSGDVEAFDPSMLGANTTGPSKRLGIHLAEDPNLANEYAKDVVPASHKKLVAKADQAIDKANAGLKDIRTQFGKDEAAWPEEAQKQKRNLLADILEANDKVEISERKIRALDPSAGANVIPVHIKMQKPYVIDLEGGQIGSEAYAEALRAKNSGKYDGIIFKNAFDAPGPFKAGQPLPKPSNVHVVFDPSQIRSKFAEFNPAKAVSSKLSEAEGGVIPKMNNGGDVKPQAGIDSDVAALQSYLQGPSAQGAASPSAQGASASPEDLSDLQAYLAPELRKQKYGAPLEQLKAGAEGLAKGIAGPLATAAEVGLGVKPEDIMGRAEANPLTHYGSEALGLVGPALLTGGASAEARIAAEGAGLAGQAIAKHTLPGLMTAAGEAGAKALGLAAPKTSLAKVGSAGVKFAIENLILGGSDEASKAILGDPNQTVESAIMNIGLSGVLGAGLGAGGSAAHQLWAAKMAPKANEFFSALKNRVNGTPMALDRPVEEAMAKSGISPQPALRAAMSGDKAAEDAFGILREAKNKTVMEGLEDLHGQVQNKMLETIGKTPEEIIAHDRHDLGTQAMEVLGNEIKDIHAPIEAAYDELEAPFRSTELPKRQVTEIPGTNPYLAHEPSTFETTPGFSDTMADKIGQLAAEKNWASGTAPQSKVIQFALEHLPQIKTIEDLKNLISNVGSNYYKDPQLVYASGAVKRVLQDGLEDVLGEKMAAKGPELYAKYKATSAAYRAASGIRDEMASNLGLGHPGGLKDFLKRFAEKRTAEETLRRLSPKNDAGLIDFLGKHFPQTLEKVRQNEVVELARNSVLRAPPGQSINTNSFSDAVKGLSPQMKEFLFPNGGADVVTAARDVIEALPQHKSSGTPGWLDHMTSYVPASATALAAALMHANPIAGFLMGQGAKMLARDVPDAIRLATLKFLGSDQPVKSEALRSAVNFIDSANKGRKAMEMASRNVFKAGAEVVNPAHMPTAQERAKLEKHLDEIAQNNMSLADKSQDIAHYMPEHATSSAEAMMRAAQYLNSLKPPTGDGAKANPLDSPAPVSADRKAAYNNALNIAQNPLIVMGKVKQGSVTPQDMNHLKNLYPSLYGQMTSQVQKAMIDHIAKGEVVPYKTKQGLTLFLGQPMDSTMTPFAIQAIQAFQQGNQAAQGQTAESLGPKQPTLHDMKGIAKMPQSYQTPDQARQQRSLRQK